jgi:hypothetical protein
LIDLIHFLCCLSEWCQEYEASHTLDTGELQKEIDEYMVEFDRKKLEVHVHSTVNHEIFAVLKVGEFAFFSISG